MAEEGMEKGTLRIRCPKDNDPAKLHEHVAFDVRTPMPLEYCMPLAQASHCVCGAAMMILRGDVAEAY